jgi:hypothetical protein
VGNTPLMKFLHPEIITVDPGYADSGRRAALQITLPLIVLRDAKVQANRFRMTNMQVAIRLRRETGVNSGVLTSSQIFIDDLANKVTRAGFSLTHRGFLKA